MFAEYVARGTLLKKGVLREVAEASLRRFALEPPKDLLEFYVESDGIEIPCMDAEDGRILGHGELVPLKSVNLSVNFPLSSGNSQSSLVFTSENVETSVLLTPLIDSALYAWNYSDGACWALFHHGEDTRYETFADLILGETNRVLRSLRDG